MARRAPARGAWRIRLGAVRRRRGTAAGPGDRSGVACPAGGGRQSRSAHCVARRARSLAAAAYARQARGGGTTARLVYVCRGHDAGALPPRRRGYPAAPPRTRRRSGLGAMARARHPLCLRRPSADRDGARMNIVVPLTAALAPPGLLALALRAIAVRAPQLEGLPPALPEATLESEVAGARAVPAPADAALVALVDALGLDDATLLAVAVTAAVESDPNLCRTLAAVQAPIGGPRPLVGLLATAFAALGPADFILRLTEGPAVHS